MKLFGLQLGREKRASVEDPRIPISDTNALLAFFGVQSANLPAVTLESALTVPAVAAAVAFLSGTMANLPLHAYRDRGDGGAERLTGSLQRILNEAPNAEWSSHDWRRYFWQQVFSSPGRGLAWIERSGTAIVGIWPMNAASTNVFRKNGRRFYQAEGQRDPYPAADVIDVAFLRKADQLGVYSPIQVGAKAIQLALAMGDYASGFFASGGVPPLSLAGPLPVGAEAMRRAQADIKRAIDAAKASADPVFPIPPGYDLKPVGFDPEKGQMTEARQFQVEEIARIYNLPPVFLQDLSHGTFSNTEQQDLQLTKHLITRWARAFEDELNLKLFGAANNRRYVEHNLDGLMRGDFASRMAGLAQGIQNGLITPNEGRSLENRPPMPNGDQLMIQGATVPLGAQPVPPSNGAPNVAA